MTTPTPTPNQLPTVLGVGSLTPEAIPAGHPDSDPILRAACWAVMRERGYSDETILATETLTHKAAGCEWEMNTYSWLCEDENGDSAHPVMDELDELEGTLHDALEVVQPLIAAQAKGEALAPILALHRPEKRWTTPDYTGSFDTREEAAELDESYDGPNVDYFEICAECGRIERDWAEDHAEEWTYKLAMWPCKTAAAVLP